MSELRGERVRLDWHMLDCQMPRENANLKCTQIDISPPAPSGPLAMNHRLTRLLSRPEFDGDDAGFAPESGAIGMHGDVHVAGLETTMACQVRSSELLFHTYRATRKVLSILG